MSCTAYRAEIDRSGVTCNKPNKKKCSECGFWYDSGHAPVGGNYIGRAIANARKLAGFTYPAGRISTRHYVFNTAGPKKFDCSGLILYCADREGIRGLPHEARVLYRLGRPVAKWALLPGDMLCFDTVRDSDPSDHVGFYMGGNCFVHASSSKHKVVVSAFEGFYREKFTGARRLGCAYL